MRHLTHAITFAGRRSNNEDAVFQWHRTVNQASVSIIAVADGMGGHACGEVASKLAVDILESRWETFQKGWDRYDEVALRKFIASTCQVINESIQDRSAEDSSLNGMGTTLVAAFVVDRRALFANIGDSRAYLCTPTEITQLTEDHSVVADSIRRGIMTPQEATTNPYRHALMRSLDGGNEAAVDIIPPEGWMEVPAGSVAMVCSDGLTGFVPEAQLQYAFISQKKLSEACEEQVALAYEQGSDDNISIVALEIGQLARSPAQRARHNGRKGKLSSRRMSMRHLLAVLAGMILVGLIGLLVVLVWPLWTEREGGGTHGILQVAPVEVLVVPLSDQDHLSWSFLGDPVEAYQVWMYRQGEEGIGSDRRLLHHTVYQDTVLYLKQLAAQEPVFFTAGLLEWEVWAFVGHDTLKSKRSTLRLSPATSPK